MDTKHIVLVEDNPDDELLTMRAIQKLGMPIDVTVARDGVTALSLFESATQETLPDLVLLDLKLPKVNGLEVLRWVRANEATMALPMVVFTSSNEEQDIRETYVLYVNSYIRKPVDFHQFSDAVQQICRYWLMLNIPSPAVS
jgi:two-component system, response regulator